MRRRAVSLLGPIVPVVIVRDPTDLIALPSLAVAWWIGRHLAVRVTSERTNFAMRTS
jgi:hypothetical protein